MERVVAMVLLFLGFIALSAWWLDSRFGPELTVTILLGVTHLLAFAGGAVLSFVITRGSLRAVNEFAKLDAQNDRYRQQSFKAQAVGESAMQRAAAQLDVIDARRVDRLARQQAALMTRPAQEEDSWSWDDDDESESEYARRLEQRSNGSRRASPRSWE